MKIADTGIPAVSSAITPATKKADTDSAYAGALPSGAPVPKGTASLRKVPASSKSWPEAAHSRDRAAIQRAAERLNGDPSFIQRSLRFKVHQKTGEVFVQVTNSETGKVLSTIPSEAVLDMQARFRTRSSENVPAILVDQKA